MILRSSAGSYKSGYAFLCGPKPRETSSSARLAPLPALLYCNKSRQELPEQRVSEDAALCLPPLICGHAKQNMALPSRPSRPEPRVFASNLSRNNLWTTNIACKCCSKHSQTIWKQTHSSSPAQGRTSGQSPTTPPVASHIQCLTKALAIAHQTHSLWVAHPWTSPVA